MSDFEYKNKYVGNNIYTVVKREDAQAFQLGSEDPAHIKAEQKYIRAGTLKINGMTAEEALKAVENPELVRDKTFLLRSKEGELAGKGIGVGNMATIREKVLHSEN